MSLNLKRNRNTWKSSVATGAVVLGVSFVVLKTFPHLKKTITDYIKRDDSEAEDNEPIELKKSVDEEEGQTSFPDIKNLEDSTVDVVQWSTEDLKSFLIEKEISTPEDTSHNNLVSLVKSIQETSK